MTATQPTLPAADFAAKWRDNARRERASSQEHFIDLCRMLGVPTPNEADPTGEHYSFEAGAQRTSSGNRGAADVWKRGVFGWEYKGAHADLGAAYRQLLDYREALENPPLLVVSDMDRIEVHTNFTAAGTAIHIVTLDDLDAGGERTAEALRVLRAVMLDPEALRPQKDARRDHRGRRRPLRRDRALHARARPRSRGRRPPPPSASSSASSPRTRGCSRSAS